MVDTRTAQQGFFERYDISESLLLQSSYNRSHEKVILVIRYAGDFLAKVNDASTLNNGIANVSIPDVLFFRIQFDQVRDLESSRPLEELNRIVDDSAYKPVVLYSVLTHSTECGFMISFHASGHGCYQYVYRSVSFSHRSARANVEHDNKYRYFDVVSSSELDFYHPFT